MGVIALAMIMSTLVVTSDALADSAKDRKNKVLDKHIDAGGKHGEGVQKIKDKLNGDSGTNRGRQGD